MALIQLSATYLGLDRLDEAERTLVTACRPGFESASPSAGIERRIIGSRIALARGQLGDALHHHRALCAQIDGFRFARGRGYVLSVVARIELAAFGRVSDEHLQQLSDDYQRARELANQDYIAASLVMALKAIGRCQDADELLRDYLHIHRRERGALPNDLAALSAELSGLGGPTP
jgi:hypothetical protein